MFVNISPFHRQHSIWLCQWRVLEEYWRKNGILCLESGFYSCLYGALPEGTFLTSRQGFFVCLFGWFFFFFFLPESIGSDEERVVDVLWWVSVVPQQATSQRPDSCSPALAWGTSVNITSLYVSAIPSPSRSESQLESRGREWGDCQVFSCFRCSS